MLLGCSESLRSLPCPKALSILQKIEVRQKFASQWRSAMKIFSSPMTLQCNHSKALSQIQFRFGCSLCFFLASCYSKQTSFDYQRRPIRKQQDLLISALLNTDKSRRLSPLPRLLRPIQPVRITASHSRCRLENQPQGSLSTFTR